MVDSQQGLRMFSAENQTARTAGILVIGAVVGLILLRKLSISGSVSTN